MSLFHKKKTNVWIVKHSHCVALLSVFLFALLYSVFILYVLLP